MTTATRTRAPRARDAADRSAQRPPRTAPPPLAPRGRRRPGLVALGVALTALGALATVWLVTSVGDRAAVLTLARDVPAGTVITQSDLARTQVAVDPAVATVPADAAATFVGMVAAGDLVAGSLLAPGQLTPTAPPGEGEVLVALAVKATQLPAGGLAAGDRLLVVDTPQQGSDPSSTPPATLPATVVRIGPPDVNGVSVLDVTTGEGDGPALAVRAATGRFALVLLPDGGR